MNDGPSRADSDRERVRDRLRELARRRKHLDRQRQDLTEEIHQALRSAHEAGWTWSEIADFAGYENATVARNQATPRSQRPPLQHPPDTYSVREAADKLGVSPQTIYTWIAAGRLAVVDGPGRGRRVFLASSETSADKTQ